MKKRYLMTPGPTMVPPEVLLNMAQSMIHHRAPDFTPIFRRVSENLKYVFQTENPVVIFASSGTGAMEASIINTLSAGDKAIAVEGGKFGQRWCDLCSAYKVNVVKLSIDWSKSITPEEIEKALKENPDTKAVFITLCETSSGALTDIKAIGEVVKKTDAILVVDAISGLGAEEFYTDKWNVDITVTGSQKALMLPPGLAFASINKKAEALMEKSTLPKYYFSIKKSLKNLKDDTTPYTPAVSLLIGLDKSLEMIKEEGIENIWARHKKLANAIRAGIKTIGLELYPKNPSNVVTTVKVPEGIDGGKIIKILRDKYGITIAGGQDHLKGKIFRIATLGYADTFDVTTIISALELTLAELGHKLDVGEGTKAAIKALL